MARTEEQATGAASLIRADYTVEIVGDVICLVDLDRGGKSVTNDAANVIEELRKNGIPVGTLPVIYRGSLGNWDELIIRQEVFKGYRSLARDDQPVTLRDKAIAIVNGVEQAG